MSGAAALVLAAGRSSRMAPAHKLLEPFGTSTVIGETVRRLSGARVDPLVVVTGHEAARVASAVAGTRARVVLAAEHAAGLSASLRAGLAELPAGAEWMLVALGDMPLVRTETIERLLAAAGSTKARVIVPVYGGRRGNPVLWHASMRPALMGLAGDEGGRSLLTGPQVGTVGVDDPGVHEDLDDREGLARARAKLPGGWA